MRTVKLIKDFENTAWKIKEEGLKCKSFKLVIFLR